MGSMYKPILLFTLVIGAISSGIYSIVWGSETWERGIYAGQHFNNARQTALTALLTEVGPGVDASQIKYGTPNVKNTRLLGGFGEPQIRIFRFLVRGKLYCVTTWNSGTNATVRRGCHT